MAEPLRDLARDGDRAFKALDLVVRRRLNGLLQGDRAGMRLGGGSEPEEVVRYRAGEDDVRRMDWNVTARTGEPHVWRPLAEHELDTWVLVDETPSMDFGTARSEKRDVAALVAGSVGLLTDGPGNRVGVAHLTPDGLEWDAPLPGRVSARRTLRTVAGAPRAEVRRDTTTLGEAITALERRHRRPGLRVIVSDFIDPDGATDRPFTWEPALRRLCSRHDVIVMEVLDPREMELPDLGLVVLRDPESGRSREVHTSAALRRRYAELAARHRADVADAVRSTGAGHVVVRTDSDWVRDLARYILSRRRARRPVRRVR
ncbi:hypothetical protein N802_14460 [Knoellia sinensis KCTC 19936]|uniref:DUF58 domain-containing protein n=1 Tax=Knoellia sinensis KCTC 19936 TaxID=1385520 RepID=A0A0A0J782_9MICO|nr:DUF58 domain-containing protein [Knoellia sinensis]KGN33245.1 hypothetical protein N802_14460 [Knoellia sinensis KCTC 19936]